MLNYPCALMWKVVLRIGKPHSRRLSQNWSLYNLYLTLAGEFHSTCSVIYLMHLVLFPQNQLLHKHTRLFTYVYEKNILLLTSAMPKPYSILTNNH